MTDVVSTAARATARQLTADYGPLLEADVEAALNASSVQRTDQFFLDPISLGSFIVSVVSLAWTIYKDLKKKTPNPSPEELTTTVRVELRARGQDDPGTQDKIADVAVTEVIKAATTAG